MSSAVLEIEDSLSEHGLRRLHFARMSHPLVKADWIDRIPPEVDHQTIQIESYIEEPGKLDVHHLWIFWRATEVIRMVDAKKTHEQWTCWWWLGKEPGITYYPSVGIDAAATLYRRVRGEWPVWAGLPLVDAPERNKPPKEIAVEDGAEKAVLPIIKLAWVPENFVVVMGKEVAI